MQNKYLNLKNYWIVKEEIKNKKKLKRIYFGEKVSLDQIYNSDHLYPEWYKYIQFTDEIKDLLRSVYKTPSGEEYLEENKEDYQKIKRDEYGNKYWQLELMPLLKKIQRLRTEKYHIYQIIGESILY